jgi:hypothetical protein
MMMKEIMRQSKSRMDIFYTVDSIVEDNDESAENAETDSHDTEWVLKVHL